MEQEKLTREEEIWATMQIFGGSRMDAEELVAIAHGESNGDCVEVDENGNESRYQGPSIRDVQKKSVAAIDILPTAT